MAFHPSSLQRGPKLGLESSDDFVPRLSYHLGPSVWGEQLAPEDEFHLHNGQGSERPHLLGLARAHSSQSMTFSSPLHSPLAGGRTLSLSSARAPGVTFAAAPPAIRTTNLRPRPANTLRNSMSMPASPGSPAGTLSGMGMGMSRGTRGTWLTSEPASSSPKSAASYSERRALMGELQTQLGDAHSALSAKQEDVSRLTKYLQTQLEAAEGSGQKSVSSVREATIHKHLLQVVSSMEVTVGQATAGLQDGNSAVAALTTAMDDVRKAASERVDKVQREAEKWLHRMTKDVEKYLVKKRIKWEEDNIRQLQAEGTKQLEQVTSEGTKHREDLEGRVCAVMASVEEEVKARSVETASIEAFKAVVTYKDELIKFIKDKAAEMIPREVSLYTEAIIVKELAALRERFEAENSVLRQQLEAQTGRLQALEQELNATKQALSGPEKKLTSLAAAFEEMQAQMSARMELQAQQLTQHMDKEVQQMKQSIEAQNQQLTQSMTAQGERLAQRMDQEAQQVASCLDEQAAQIDKQAMLQNEQSLRIDAQAAQISTLSMTAESQAKDVLNTAMAAVEEARTLAATACNAAMAAAAKAGDAVACAEGVGSRLDEYIAEATRIPSEPSAVVPKTPRQSDDGEAANATPEDILAADDPEEAFMEHLHATAAKPVFDPDDDMAAAFKAGDGTEAVDATAAAAAGEGQQAQPSGDITAMAMDAPKGMFGNGPDDDDDGDMLDGLHRPSQIGDEQQPAAPAAPTDVDSQADTQTHQGNEAAEGQHESYPQHDAAAAAGESLGASGAEPPVDVAAEAPPLPPAAEAAVAAANIGMPTGQGAAVDAAAPAEPSDEVDARPNTAIITAAPPASSLPPIISPLHLSSEITPMADAGVMSAVDAQGEAGQQPSPAAAAAAEEAIKQALQDSAGTEVDHIQADAPAPLPAEGVSTAAETEVPLDATAAADAQPIGQAAATVGAEEAAAIVPSVEPPLIQLHAEGQEAPDSVLEPAAHDASASDALPTVAQQILPDVAETAGEGELVDVGAAAAAAAASDTQATDGVSAQAAAETEPHQAADAAGVMSGEDALPEAAPQQDFEHHTSQAGVLAVADAQGTALGEQVMPDTATPGGDLMPQQQVAGEVVTQEGVEATGFPPLHGTPPLPPQAVAEPTPQDGYAAAPAEGVVPDQEVVSAKGVVPAESIPAAPAAAADSEGRGD